MRNALIAAALTAAAAAAPAAAQTGPGEPRINQIIVYGDDPCPQSSDAEIVVCARRPDGDRYRIPEALRGVGPDDPANEAWALKVESLEIAGRTGIGSCSTAGAGGFTGCFDQLVRQYRGERATGDGTNWSGLVAAAREERLNRIDAESEAIERELTDDE